MVSGVGCVSGYHLTVRPRSGLKFNGLYCILNVYFTGNLFQVLVEFLNFRRYGAWVGQKPSLV